MDVSFAFYCIHYIEIIIMYGWYTEDILKFGLIVI